MMSVLGMARCNRCTATYDITDISACECLRARWCRAPARARRVSGGGSVTSPSDEYAMRAFLLKSIMIHRVQLILYMIHRVQLIHIPQRASPTRPCRTAARAHAATHATRPNYIRRPHSRPPPALAPAMTRATTTHTLATRPPTRAAHAGPSAAPQPPCPRGTQRRASTPPTSGRAAARAKPDPRSKPGARARPGARPGARARATAKTRAARAQNRAAARTTCDERGKRSRWHGV